MVSLFARCREEERRFCAARGACASRRHLGKNERGWLAVCECKREVSLRGINLVRLGVYIYGGKVTF